MPLSRGGRSTRGTPRVGAVTTMRNVAEGARIPAARRLGRHPDMKSALALRVDILRGGREYMKRRKWMAYCHGRRWTPHGVYAGRAIACNSCQWGVHRHYGDPASSDVWACRNDGQVVDGMPWMPWTYALAR
ncbi:hypothetical protein GSI_14122 [Ganoderma sinense ZZ0214-1]|uniref:Uncharacterized protein n=1 Tax=Ganoderma sinense ZZ0214-1 TaxID=1077348 RepID=A0A2G8RS75_9APHY|nr:hypothetical protein GSI_14122 [Ganoderma sinense ZZ0214-1]